MANKDEYVVDNVAVAAASTPLYETTNTVEGLAIFSWTSIVSGRFVKDSPSANRTTLLNLM